MLSLPFCHNTNKFDPNQKLLSPLTLHAQLLVIIIIIIIIIINIIVNYALQPSGLLCDLG
jgi:hypothetical protein